jgi:hypothetical protein
MTIKLTAWSLQQVAETYDSEAKRALALSLVRGLSETITRRLSRDETYTRLVCQDAAVSGKACLASLNR